MVGTVRIKETPQSIVTGMLLVDLLVPAAAQPLDRVDHVPNALYQCIFHDIKQHEFQLRSLVPTLPEIALQTTTEWS